MTETAHGRLAGKASDATPDGERPKELPAAPIDVRSAALTIVAVIVVAAVLHVASVIFIPIIFAVLLSYVLDPIVAGLTRWRVPRALGAFVVMLALAGAIGWTGWVLSDEAMGIVEQLPEAAERIGTSLVRSPAESGAPVKKVQEAAEELERAAAEATSTPAPRGVTRVQIEEPALGLRDYLVAGSWGLLAFAGQALVVFFLALYMLASGDLFKRKLVRLAGPSLSKRKVTIQILDEINSQIAWFLFQRAVVSLIVAVATWLSLRAFGLEHAALWGIGAGVANTIPYIGPAVIAVAVSAAAFMQFDNMALTAGVAGVTVFITSLEGYLLTPWLTGRIARMNEVAVFTGLLFWGWLWGIWGMLLAVPLMMVLKTVCDRIEDLKPIGDLLGE